MSKCRHCEAEFAQSRFGRPSAFCSRVCYRKARYIKKPEEFHSTSEKWRAKNPDKHREYKRKHDRRKREKRAEDNPYPGFIYVLENPTTPGYSKVGRAANLASRLRGYNLSDPLKRFTYAAVFQVTDTHLAEFCAHEALRGYRHRGEWFAMHPVDASAIIEQVLADTGLIRMGGAPLEQVRDCAAVRGRGDNDQ